MGMKLHDHFKEFLRLLNDHRVEYLLIGGYAVGAHGYPRATKDLDVWVSAEPANAARLSSAMQDFGFPPEQVPPRRFENPDAIFRMGFPPVQIEISTSISGVEFQACLSRANHLDMEGLPVAVISLPDLRANKQASGRARDLDDLENLP
jgi:predicted nucleotidyltransferase